MRQEKRGRSFLRLGTLFSGGKDSTLASFLAVKQGHELVCLGSMKTENKNSYMFHYPNFELTKLSAKAMNKKIVTHQTLGLKEKELSDLKYLLLKMKELHDVEGIITGALASNYQYKRITKILDELNLVGVNPLWQINPEKEIEILLQNNFKAVIVGVAAKGLNKTHLGKTIDKTLFQELKELTKKLQINIAGEGGEYETLVLDCPLYKKKIKIKKASIDSQGQRHFLIIKKAVLEYKN